jgi:cytochrome c oxidase cbb3-type subunit 3
MLKLSCAALAAAAVLALSGCSRSAADPAGERSSGAPPPPPAAAAAAESAAAPPPQNPVASGVRTAVPPTLAPVGPIPGPRIAGENPGETIQNPYANDQSALEQGRQLFVEMNCAGCHGGHAGGGMGPDLRPDHIFKFGNTPADLFDSISQGRGMGMPSWGMKLPPDVIWKLVAYIQSLGTAQEPSKAAAAPTGTPESIASPSY